MSQPERQPRQPGSPFPFCPRNPNPQTFNKKKRDELAICLVMSTCLLGIDPEIKKDCNKLRLTLTNHLCYTDAKFESNKRYLESLLLVIEFICRCLHVLAYRQRRMQFQWEKDYFGKNGEQGNSFHQKGEWGTFSAGLKLKLKPCFSN